MDNVEYHVNDAALQEWDYYDNDSGYDSNSDSESDVDSGYYDSD